MTVTKGGLVIILVVPGATIVIAVVIAIVIVYAGDEALKVGVTKSKHYTYGLIGWIWV